MCVSLANGNQVKVTQSGEHADFITNRQWPPRGCDHCRREANPARAPAQNPEDDFTCSAWHGSSSKVVTEIYWQHREHMEMARRGMSRQVQSFPDYKADDFVVSKFHSHVAAEAFSSSFTLA